MPLTPEQQKRVARQKELAVARRALRYQQHSWALDPCNRATDHLVGTQQQQQHQKQHHHHPWSLSSCSQSTRLVVVHSASLSNNEEQGDEASHSARLAGVQDLPSAFHAKSHGGVDAVRGGGSAHPIQKDGADTMPRVSESQLSSFSAHREEDESRTPTLCTTNYLKFSRQQVEVLIAVAQGKSVFVTGSAGTGKSYLLGFIVRLLQDRWGPECVFVTASTGLAACALGGTTLHSFAGIGLGTDNAETMAAKAFGKQECRDRWRRAKVIIIDEISMIDGDLFDKLNYVAREVRKNGTNYKDHCFGGIQLIVTGDFFQLPPVKPQNHHKYFAFEADCWDQSLDLQIELTHPFRQSDKAFVSMLNEVRMGHCSSHTLHTLQACARALEDDGSGISPTRLYPLKVDVKEENMRELKALKKPVITYRADDWAASLHYLSMLDGMRAEKELELCVGAQVMLLKNMDTKIGFVNGALGVVVGFDTLRFKEGDAKAEVAQAICPALKWPIVRFACNKVEKLIGPERQTLECGGVEVARRTQVPIILAWAVSVHKCQGMTLDRVDTDLAKAFDYGMVYVALSRVKSLDGLQLVGFDPTRIRVHPNVVSFYEKLTSCQFIL